MKFKLVPNAHLVSDTNTQLAQWTVVGAKPGFDVDNATGQVPTPGWYFVTTDLKSSTTYADGTQTDASAILKFFPESGSVHLVQRPIPVVQGRRARVVHVPPGTARIALDVSPWLDTVSGSELTLKPLPQGVAAGMMSADVAASAALGQTNGRAMAGRLKKKRDADGVRAMLEEVALAYEKLQGRRSGHGLDQITDTEVHYPKWRSRFSTTTDSDIERLKERSGALTNGGPQISVVIPVYNPEIDFLEAAIESVRSQSYDNWQLCLTNDASTNPGIAACLDKFAASDSRIRVHHRTENGHIAAATNDALELATGEFVAFMDHDDLLAPFALAAVALVSEGADILYTDEDKIDADGRHYDPHFKPSWNPELLLGQNYMSHLSVIRRSLIDDVGAMRAGFDGSQDHDLLLRATAGTTADRIRHIPLVAYHWRAIEGSTALAPGEKSYTEDASIRALKDSLGEQWLVDRAPGATAYRCSPPLSETPLVSIVIPTRDYLDLVIQCVESLAKTSYPAFEILIVDNDSVEPETLEWFTNFDNGDDQRVIPAPGPFNYSKINNIGVRAAKGELILLLNNDTEVIEPDWLSAMVAWILQENVGAVGAKLLYPDDTIQHAGVILGLGGFAGHGHTREPRDATGYFNRLVISHEVGAATAACLLTRRSTWEQLGGLDEDLAVAFNDVDYCLRVRHVANQRIVWTPEALLYHHESISRGYEDDPVKVARFNSEVDYALGRWADVLDDDPAYSPNLALDQRAFTIAKKPRVVLPWAAELPAQDGD